MATAKPCYKLPVAYCEDYYNATATTHTILPAVSGSKYRVWGIYQTIGGSAQAQTWTAGARTLSANHTALTRTINPTTYAGSQDGNLYMPFIDGADNEAITLTLASSAAVSITILYEVLPA